MKIVFFGSSQFGLPALKAIVENNYEVICVVTQPDRQKGRGLKFLPTPVKQIAKELGLLVYQPEKINTVEAIKFLKDLNADLFVVIAYGQILLDEILNIPKIFSLNVHASLLPKYRGAAPINWAIINGDKTTGITIIKMTKKMDAGPIILQKSLEILEDDTAITLEERLSFLSSELLITVLDAIKKDNYKLIPQDESKVSFAPRLKKEDGLIDWNKSAVQINNLIRGCTGWPGAFTYYKGKLLKIYKANVVESKDFNYRLPGQILKVDKEGIVVATQEGDLVITELQLEGKRRMKVEEFILGHKISIGDRFNKKIA